MDSGGDLLPEQAAYNTTFYDLNFQVFPEEQKISGDVKMHFRITRPVDRLLVDFDTVFTIQDIKLTSPEDVEITKFENPDGLVRINLDRQLRTGEKVILNFVYDGKPRVANNPPWDGGFTWDKTSDGKHFIGVSCQGNGANIWWPNKDHPSDRADSAAINIRVPDELVAVSNGRSRGVIAHDDGTKTHQWFVSTSINNYAISMNIGPYEVIEKTFESVTGESIPVFFWMLPENYEKAEELLIDVEAQFRHFEEVLGPYPFRADKYGIVEAPYFGMEHQTLIAYGAGFQNDTVFDTDSGFDDLHHHELAHEWWGNMVAADDWKDFWIHEGFGTYMQPLYAEHLHGSEQYQHFMNKIRERINNDYPIAPKTSKTATEMFRGRDIYMKGAWVLHMLRYQMGDELFFEAFRRFAYPTAESENVTDGRHTRHASTNEFISHIEYYYPVDLSWFYEVYLRQAELPELVVNRSRRNLELYWNSPVDASFEMPLEISVNGEIRKVELSNIPKQIRIGRRAEIEIDPSGWILFELKEED